MFSGRRSARPPYAPFDRFSKRSARTAGHATTLVLAVVVILVWVATGPIFHFSDTWQLVINTATTIVTFLMVFLIQNTQNRESEALQLKLDELIRALGGAHNAMLDLEELSEEQLDAIKKRYEHLAEDARNHLSRRKAGKPASESGQHRPKPAKLRRA